MLPDQPFPSPARGSNAPASVATGVLAGVHVDLDCAAASAGEALGLPRIEARTWGPRVRFFARERVIESFWREIEGRLAPLVLCGSGDFHHLTALWQRRAAREGEYHLVSFDNHPDWDMRPPAWACGAWVGRALANPALRSVTVWGCGNFELALPHRLFRSRDARLSVRPWCERLSPANRRRYGCIDRESWREEFARFADSLAGRRVYVTIDLDCLRHGVVYSNWEHGLFEVDDLTWALGLLHARAEVVGGDLCGAWSEQEYDGWFKRLAAWWDHPRLALPGRETIGRVNAEAMIAVWRALAGA
ncbi:MAG: hypothetical protein AB7K52_10425 [Phycisphaerales bacterium]